MLLPVAIIVGGLNFLIVDQAVPAAAPALHWWGIGDYAAKKTYIAANDPIWIRSGDDIIRAKQVSADQTTLTDIIIFKRQENGLLDQQIFAKSATKNGQQWQLQDVNIYSRDGDTPRHVDNLVYHGTIRLLSGGDTDDPEELSLRQLNAFIANNGYGLRPVYVYQTWWHKRLGPIFVAFIMVALCMPLATRFRRGGGLGGLFGLGVGLGFMYFVSDAIATSIGELGLVSPWLAAWTPIILFGTVAAALVARTEQA